MNAAELHQLDAHQLREMVQSLQARVQATESALTFKQAVIDKITHEMAVLKRMKFGAKAERYSAEQASLLQEAVETDLEALACELDCLVPGKQAGANRQTARRLPLPAHLPRREVHHEPHDTTCHCGCALKRIGEDVAEKLDYQPGVFTVERHVRGKWVCSNCETLVQAPVPPHVIDKGIPTAGLLAQVLVAKYADHLPLYRQEGIFARAGMSLSRSTLAQWVGTCGVQLHPLVEALKRELLLHPVLHADETPVAMLKPGNGKTHRAYLWSYCSTRFAGMHAVVFDFAESRAGHHARDFLGVTPSAGWRGTLVCDDFSGYKQLFSAGVVEAGCLAHARRKFYELWVNHQSTVAEQALKLFSRLYDIERQLQELTTEERLQRRRNEAKPVADLLHAWLLQQRALVPSGSATARAIHYTLGRWDALTRYLDDGRLPPDNNRVENQIRPVALGRANWLFAGSLRAGQRAAAVMSLVHSARLNGHDPYAYLRNVLERLPTHPASRVGELLPHRWSPDCVGATT